MTPQDRLHLLVIPALLIVGFVVIMIIVGRGK